MKYSLNLDKISKKLPDIEASISRLSEFENIPLREFLASQDMKYIASFRLIVATEAAIDVRMHLVSRIFRSIPEEYAGCFKNWAKKAFLAKNCLKICLKWPDFKIYWSISTGTLIMLECTR